MTARDIVLHRVGNGSGRIPVGFAKGRTWASLTDQELANYRGFWFNPTRFQNSLLDEVRNGIDAEYARRHAK